MKYFKLIFIVSITGVLLFLGCSKEKPLKDMQPLGETQVLQPISDSQMQEADSLFAQLEKENPFRPDHASTYISKDKGREPNQLKGIVWDAKNPYALIGDKVVAEGDYLDNKKILKINKDSIHKDF